MNIVYTVFLSSLCLPFAFAGWFGFRHQRRSAELTARKPCVSQSGNRPTTTGFEQEAVDIDAAIRDAVDAMVPMACALHVRLDLATTKAVTLRADPGSLAAVLREVLRTGIHAGAGGQALVTTSIHGMELHINVVDDGPGTDQQVRRGQLRWAETLIALRGGSIVVMATPGRGTSVTIRLPLPRETGAAFTGVSRRHLMADHAV